MLPLLLLPPRPLSEESIRRFLPWWLLLLPTCAGMAPGVRETLTAATAPSVSTDPPPPPLLDEAVTSPAVALFFLLLLLPLLFLLCPRRFSVPLSESDELDLSASGGDALPPPMVPSSESKLKPKELFPRLTRPELSELLPLPPEAPPVLDEPTPMLDDLRRRPLTMLRLRGRPIESSELPPPPPPPVVPAPPLRARARRSLELRVPLSCADRRRR
mmetsp:Transcript_29958/g.60802  ORF Transcript_29958/g.60802 Transcript_29958/m.60802 type:complete len:216 (+) Transcript_29958:294-941(+)